MQKFENVNVVNILRRIMITNTKHYRKDFIEDADKMSKAAHSDNEQDKYLLFMSRPEGTWCFDEANVFMKDTSEHNAWTFYAEQTRDNILAYAVKVTGIENGSVKGNLYELDYIEHCKNVVDTAVRADNTHYLYEKGETTEPQKKFMPPELEEYGKLIKATPIPNEPDKLDFVLSMQHRNYGILKAGDIERHIAELHNLDILRRVKSMSEDEKDDHIFTVETTIDYGMTNELTQDDIDLYHAIEAERKEKEPMTEKPSIREQLAADKVKSTAAKATPTKKSKEDISL